MKLILDGFGGDNAPDVTVRAAAQYVKESDCEIVIVGDEEKLKAVFEKNSLSMDRIHIVHASEVIGNDEKPAVAVRAKKDASIVVASRLLKEGAGDALISAGNTGAVLACALTVVGRIKGVRRPALATVLPSENGGTLLLDAGANTGCKPEDLYNFAIMGSIYMKRILKRENPRVSLLSNGEEEGKGEDTVKAAYELLSDADINFAGNCEGRDIMLGKTEVVVCDGFAGNVALKSIEGTAKLISGGVKEMFMSGTLSKLCALILGKQLKTFRKKFDYKEYGGAPLLGVKAPVIKAHGSSDVRSLCVALSQAERWVKENINNEISAVLGEKSNKCKDAE